MVLNLIEQLSADLADTDTSHLNSQHAGRFRTGYMIDGDPKGLDSFRVTASDIHIANFIAKKYGGVVQKWEAPQDDIFEVFTNTKEVAIRIESSEALHSEFAFYKGGELVYKSNGQELTFPTDRAGELDPHRGKRFKDRQALGKQGEGPNPEIKLTFHLLEHPELGAFNFVSRSWAFLYDLAYKGAGKAIAETQVPLRMVFALEETTFTTKSGVDVTYSKTVLRDIAPIEGK